jgi:hypothetical protein
MLFVLRVRVLMRSVGDSPVSWVVVGMAFSSLLSMVCLFQLDWVVEGGFLGLSSAAYVSYSMWVRLAFVLGWVNIVAAFGVHLYSVTFKRKELEVLVREAEIAMRRKQVEVLRRVGAEEPPILPGLPEDELLSKSEGELEREEEMLAAAA